MLENLVILFTKFTSQFTKHVLDISIYNTIGHMKKLSSIFILLLILIHKVDFFFFFYVKPKLTLELIEFNWVQKF